MALANKTFQDLITFTRSTSGSYVGSDGYLVTSTPVVNYLPYSSQFDNAVWTKNNSVVQTNLLVYSEQFDNTPIWSNSLGGTGVASTVTANQGTAPDGTLTADRIQFNLGGGTTIADLTRRIQSYVTAAVTHTYSIYVRSFDGVSTYNMHIVGSTGATTNIVVTGSWQRFEVSAVGTGGSVAYAIGLRGGQTPANSNTADVLVWGAQLVRGSVPGNYQATVASAFPVLYPDYNSVRRARKLVTNSGTATVVAQSMINYPSSYSTTEDRVLTVYAKSDGLRYLLIGVHNGGGYTITAAFDIVNGTFAAADGHPSYGNAINNSITSVGNGWYRCSTVIDAFDTNAKVPYIVGSSTYGGIFNRDCTGDGTSGIYITDAQLAPGTSVGPYYENDTSTVTYAPRVDYNPVTLQSRGMLFEGQRANLLTYSEQFDNAIWVKNSATVAANATTAPDGTTTADNLSDDSAGGTGVVGVTRNITIANTTHTFSFYAKANGLNWVSLQITGFTSSPVSGSCYYDLANGVVGGINAIFGTITNVGNGWFRCTGIVTPDAGDLTGNFAIYVADGNGDIIVDRDGTSSVYIWGAQLEAGDGASTYIPTVASQVTRATDFGSVNNLAPWFTASQGTYYVEFDLVYNSGAGNNSQIAMSAKTGYSTGNGMLVRTAPPASVQYGGNSSALTIAGLSLNPPVTVKVAATFQGVNAKFCANGGAVSTMATMDFTGVGTVALLFAQLNTGGLQQGFTHLRRVVYYPTVLSDAQLQSITT